MDKSILEQYWDLKCERKNLEKRIKELNEKKKMVLTDSVQGSSKVFPYTLRSFKIEGVASEDNPTHRKIKQYEKILEQFKEKILVKEVELEKWIQEIPNSRIRNIIRYKYIDELSWFQVSQEIGGNNTEDSVRKEFERFLKNN